jgi:tetratricopeptide (TPR) repeat protein
MSRTLSLVHGGWAAARELARRGRRSEALARLRRLLARNDVPPAVAADAHRLAAELLIDRDRLGAARRHLKAALGLEPGCARTFYLAGLASERDPAGDDRRAAARFRKAAGLEPANPRYRAAFGRAAVRCDRVRAGVRALLAAAEAGGAKLDVLRVVVDGLIEAGKLDAARRAVVKARFLNPQSAEVRRLGERVRFETARRGQQNTTGTQDAPRATEGDFVSLPFVRVVGGESGRRGVTGGTIRRDTLSVPRPHFTRLGVRNADR